MRATKEIYYARLERSNRSMRLIVAVQALLLGIAGLMIAALLYQLATRPPEAPQFPSIERTAPGTGPDQRAACAEAPSWR